MSLASSIWNMEARAKVSETFEGTVSDYIVLRDNSKTKIKATGADGGPPLEILINGIKLGQEIVGQSIRTNGGVVSEYKGNKGLMCFPKEVVLNGVQLQETNGGGAPRPQSGGAPAPQQSAPAPQREAISEIDIHRFIERTIEKFPWMTEGNGPACINTMIMGLEKGNIRLNPGVDTGVAAGIDTGEDDEVPV